jgi:hypothetical protein
MPDRDPRERNNHYEAWYTMVTKYSDRALTCEADVLSALAGLEKAIIRTHECTYCAGLWAEDLHIGLLWYVIVYTRPAFNNTLLPSWSWIAQRGCKIAYIADRGVCAANEHESITFLDFPTNEAMDSATSLSTTTSKSLRLRGKMRQVKIEPKRGTGGDPDRLNHGVLHSAHCTLTVRDVETQNLLGHMSFDSDPEIDHTLRTATVYCLLCTVGVVYDDKQRGTGLAVVSTDDTLRSSGELALLICVAFGAMVFVKVCGTQDP